MNRHPLNVEQQQKHEYRRRKHNEPPRCEVPHRGHKARMAGQNQEGMGEPRETVHGTGGQEQRARQRSDFCAEQGPHAYGHRPQNQAIPPVGEERVPQQQREYGDHRHADGDQKLLVHPARGADLRGCESGGRVRVFRYDHQYQHEAESQQQGRELAQQRRDITAQRDDLVIEEAVREQPHQGSELAFFARHAWIASTIRRAVSSGSVSVTSCEKISSSVGRAISPRSSSMELFATMRPRCRITTREQTFSTISSTCELNRTVLPVSASDRIRLRRTMVATASRPENGSSRITSSGSCSSAAPIRIFCRMPLEYDDSGECRSEASENRSSRAVIFRRSTFSGMS